MGYKTLQIADKVKSNGKYAIMDDSGLIPEKLDDRK